MIVAAFVALTTTLVLLVLLGPLLVRLNLVDVPNTRSSHTRPVLRGGGLAIAVGTSAGLVIGDVVDGRSGVALLVVSTGFAAVGFADDRRSRPVTVRLVAQFVLAIVGAILLATEFDLASALVAVAGVVTVFWIVGYVNVFNFMDGINGISAVTAAIIGVTHMVAGTQIDSDLVSVAGAALVGGAIAFVPFNFPVARMFAGDVGSYFLGSYIAILSVIALTAGASLVTVAAPLMVYLFDTTYTMARRALSGKSIFEAHRDHSYQYLANRRLNHKRTTTVVGVITAACAGIGLLAHDRTVVVAAACLLVIVFLSAVFVWLPNVLVDRRAVPRVPQ